MTTGYRVGALLLGTACALALAPTSKAAAHGLHGLLNDDYLTVGLNLGQSTRLGSGDRSLLGGFEVSWVRLRDLRWFGALGELRWEGESQSGFVALGAEAGWFIFGADLVLVARLGPQSALGARLRGCLSFAVVSACGGAALTNRGSFAEVTASLKVPIDWTPRFAMRPRG